MKFIRKVKPIEVKRCFVISDIVKYLKQVEKSKNLVLGLPEEILDLIIKGGYKKRWKLYNKLDWYIGTVNTDEVGVWKKAGGLRISWTQGSLEETANIVREVLRKNPKQLTKRSRTAIPDILKKPLLLNQKEKYLFPIIAPGGMMGRKGLKRMKGDIEDGCMRSVALAVSGKKKIKAYIGKRKN